MGFLVAAASSAITAQIASPMPIKHSAQMPMTLDAFVHILTAALVLFLGRKKYRPAIKMNPAAARPLPGRPRRRPGRDPVRLRQHDHRADALLADVGAGTGHLGAGGGTAVGRGIERGDVGGRRPGQPRRHPRHQPAGGAGLNVRPGDARARGDLLLCFDLHSGDELWLTGQR